MTAPRIAVAFISDRGDLHLPDCRESYREHILPSLAAAPVDLSTLIVDDQEHHLGMAGAVQTAWAWALAEGADYLLHIEEDFRFAGPVDVWHMASILERSTYLAQMCLKRQPWSPEERAAGDIFATWPPHELRQRQGFLVQGRLFSLNPCLIPRRILELEWPSGPLGVGNEAGFTQRCLDQGLSFGYYGRRDDPPRVIHVGDTRGEGWRL